MDESTGDELVPMVSRAKHNSVEAKIELRLADISAARQRADVLR